jgi:hypothetical protein
MLDDVCDEGLDSIRKSSIDFDLSEGYDMTWSGPKNQKKSNRSMEEFAREALMSLKHGEVGVNTCAKGEKRLVVLLRGGVEGKHAVSRETRDIKAKSDLGRNNERDPLEFSEELSGMESESDEETRDPDFCGDERHSEKKSPPTNKR